MMQTMINPAVIHPSQDGLNISFTAILDKRGNNSVDGNDLVKRCELMLRACQQKLDETIIDFIMDKMAIYLKMLGPFVKNGIRCYMNCRLIVTEKESWSETSDAKVIQKLLEVNNFTGCDC